MLQMPAALKENLSTSMRKFVFATIAICLTSCAPRIGEVTEGGEDAPIYPDYRDVTVPDNIAPLNFSFTGEGTSALKINGSKIVRPRKGLYKFSRREWRTLMDSDSARFTLLVRKGKSWNACKDFSIHVSHDKIDPYISYRLIPPGYQGWEKMGIYQRNLENYRETPIYENTNGGSQNFKPYHTEAAGFNTDTASVGNTVQAFTFTNGSYTGNIYNASGSDGLEGTTLNVTFGEGADYSGAIASTSAIHVTYDGSVAVKDNGGTAFDDADEAAAFAAQYQNTAFTIEEYWSIGQVANLVNDNSANTINVTLTDDAVWIVTATSLISSLTLEDDAQVIVPDGVTLTVNGLEYTNCRLTAQDY